MWSPDDALMIAGGGNWAEMHRKWCRSTLFVQLLPQTEKAQLVTPQTIKYGYKTVIFLATKPLEVQKKVMPQQHYFCQI